jgi:uncharacterized protein YjbK
VQINTFFDTASRALRQQRMTLRVRDESGGFTVTLKGGNKAGKGSLSMRPEEEVDVERSRAEAYLSGAANPLEAFVPSPALVDAARAAIGGAPLLNLGSFANERTRVDCKLLGVPVVLELDRTSFPGGVTHHEVELEVPDGVDAAALGDALQALFAKAGAASRPANGKAARFFGLLGI